MSPQFAHDPLSLPASSTPLLINKSRILHLLHTLPLQAVLFDIPKDAQLSGDSVHYTASPNSPNITSRRHSRAPTANTTPAIDHNQLSFITIAGLSGTSSPQQPASISVTGTKGGSVLAQALGQIENHRKVKNLGSIKLLHPATQRWGLAARRGHSALYAGIRSLEGKVHMPALVDPVSKAASNKQQPQSDPPSATLPLPASSDTDDPLISNSMASPVHECIYIGTLGPVMDPHGRIVHGYEFTQADMDELTTLLWTQEKCIPLFFDRDTAKNHYEGFCKSILWPLFHYVLWDGATDGRQEKKYWTAYQKVNQTFAAKAAELYHPGDLVWIHDYHLLLVPSMLRTEINFAHPDGEVAGTSVPIGIFLHLCFPSSELFRCLAMRSSILEGILGASLVGFQTYSYARHFVSCCTRVLGLESSPTGVDFNGHHVAVGIFPIGIDAARTEEKRCVPFVSVKAQALSELYAGKKLIVGRDKLDSIRGLVQKLKAYDAFLNQFQEWRGKVVLVQITSPTTTGGSLVTSTASSKDGFTLPGSGKLEAKVSELVAHINSKYGTLDYMPIHHIHRAIAQDEFYALLTVADAGLITSIRDGMNTTSHEFVVCQQMNMAPLILSEFTGCASSLAGAILVNPWDFAGVANAINDALVMPRDERQARHSQMMDHVTRYTAPKWAFAFTRALTGTAQRLKMGGPGGAALDAHTTPFLDRAACLADYRQISAPELIPVSNTSAKSAMRLICFDYDGTLSPIVKIPELARPTPALLEGLSSLCSDPRNIVFVISGRDQATLDAWLGHIHGIGLSAEHGSFLKYPHGDWMDLTEEHGEDPAVWKNEVVSIFNFFTERTPGSFIEHKRCSVTWHYRLADPSFGAFQAKECQNHLENAVLSKRPLECLVGKKNIEVRPIAVNKGEIVKRLLATAAPNDAAIDFIFAIGDDKTDEDMNRVLHRGPATLPSPTDTLQVPSTPSSMTTGVSNGGSSCPPTGFDTEWWPRKVWSVTVGPANKRTLADWHVSTPQQVVDILREWAGLPRVNNGATSISLLSPTSDI